VALCLAAAGLLRDSGARSILASRFCRVLQKFLTSLSVLPGRYVEILAHLFPNCAWSSITTRSSSAENLQPLHANKQTRIVQHGAWRLKSIGSFE
jgi:hypothetical protein